LNKLWGRRGQIICQVTVNRSLAYGEPKTVRTRPFLPSPPALPAKIAPEVWVARFICCYHGRSLFTAANPGARQPMNDYRFIH
jgi:hypothetical protein